MVLDILDGVSLLTRALMEEGCAGYVCCIWPWEVVEDMCAVWRRICAC